MMVSDRAWVAIMAAVTSTAEAFLESSVGS